jgi:hypothetical protein
LELADAALGRAGDRLENALSFLAARGYRAFRLEPQTGFVPISVPVDGDYWFIPVEE